MLFASTMGNTLNLFNLYFFYPFPFKNLLLRAILQDENIVMKEKTIKLCTDLENCVFQDIRPTIFIAEVFHGSNTGLILICLRIFFVEQIQP